MPGATDEPKRFACNAFKSKLLSAIFEKNSGWAWHA